MSFVVTCEKQKLWRVTYTLHARHKSHMQLTSPVKLFCGNQCLMKQILVMFCVKLCFQEWNLLLVSKPIILCKKDKWQFDVILIPLLLQPYQFHSNVILVQVIVILFSYHFHLKIIQYCFSVIVFYNGSMPF